MFYVMMQMFTLSYFYKQFLNKIPKYWLHCTILQANSDRCEGIYNNNNYYVVSKYIYKAVSDFKI